MLNSMGRNERGRGRDAGGNIWNDSDCTWRKSVGPDICSRRTDDDDLANQFFLTELPRLVVLRSRVFSLSRSSVLSYVLPFDHNGSADGRGMAAGWSRRTTMFLSDTNPRPDSLGRCFSREPQHDAKELNQEENVPDNMLAVFTQPLKVKRRPHAMRVKETKDVQRPTLKDKERAQSTCSRERGTRRRGRASHLYITSLLPDVSVADLQSG